MSTRTPLLTFLALCSVFASMAWSQSGTFTMSNGSGSPSFGTTTQTASITITAALNNGVAADTFTFGIQVIPVGSAPAVTLTSGSFVMNGALNGTLGQTVGKNAISVTITANSKKLTGTFPLGVLMIPIPSTASNGQTYTVRMASADSSDSTTGTDYPILPGAAATLTVAQTPASLTKVLGDGVRGPVTSNFVFSVAVQDGNGLGIAGINVVFTLSNGATFSNATGPPMVVPTLTVPTDITGTASVRVTFGTAQIGTFPLTATVAGLGAVTFNFTVTPGPVALIAMISGNNQIGVVGTTLANPIVVKVTDAFGNPIDDVTTTFAVVSGGGSVPSASVTTAGGGLASTSWILGSIPTINQLRASVLTGGATVAQTFTATAGQSMTLSPSQLTFSAILNSTPAPQIFNISSPSGSLNWTASPVPFWMTISASSGTTPSTVSVTINPAGLAVGSYTTAISIASPTATVSPQVVNVSFTVFPPGGIGVSQNQINFAGKAGAAAPAAQTVTISGPSGYPAISVALSASTTSGGNWLAVSPASGPTPLQASISVNPASLSAGTYSGTVTVTSSGAANSPQTVAVTLTVAPTPSIQVTPAALAFTGTVGGSNPASQSLSASLSIAGASAVFNTTATTTSGGTWLSVTNAGSAANVTTLNVAVSLAGLAAGTYTGAISVDSPGALNTPLAVPVTLTVAVPQIPPVLAVSPGVLLFTTQAGSGTSLTTQTFTVQNNNSGAAGFTVQVSTSNGGGWLSASPTTGVTPFTITVTATPGSLPQGGYNGSISIAPLPSTGATNTLVVPVGMAISAPAIVPGGVVNAAIFNTTVSPGSIISLFGVNLSASTAAASGMPLPTSLGGTQVLVNGTAAPLFYVSSQQINAQMLTGLSGNVAITVVSGNTTGVTTTVPVSSESPGIFVASGTQGAVLNQDFSPNSTSNPAAAGSVVQIFATGFGATNPPLASGQAGAVAAPFNVTVDPVTATINGQNAPVVFSAAAPGFVGLFQVNVTVPANTPSGNSVPLQLVIDSIPSNTVTICVTAAPLGSELP